MRRPPFGRLAIAASLCAIAAAPAAADPSDPFQSAPVAAPAAPKPAPSRPRQPAVRDTAPLDLAPVYSSPPPVAVPPPRPSLLGTWRGQAWQWPVVLVIQADDGRNVSLQFIGSMLVAGQPVATPPSAYTVQRGPDGSFTINQASGNALENVRPCGSDICGTYYQRQSDARAPVVFRRSP